jgi:hypothetical protein
MADDPVRAAHEAMKAELRTHRIPDSGSLIDQIKHLPKKVIYRLSYEGLKAEAPTSSTVFREQLDGVEPTTESGRRLAQCVRDLDDELDTLSPYVLAKRFVLEYMGQVDTSIDSIRYGLFLNSQTDWSAGCRNALSLIRLLWLTDPDAPHAPANIKGRGFYDALDPLSVWAWWSRQLSNPFFLDDGSHARKRVAAGYVYDLRSATGFDPPKGDLGETIKLLLQEADLLREGSIPQNAYVEINFPPFVALVFGELSADFVMVEALDADSRGLPIYLFPSLQKWVAPTAGAGPDGRMASFDAMTMVAVAMAASALRDFWVVEDRERVLGLPRLGRIAGSKSSERRVIYLPRIRYSGGRNLGVVLEGATNTKARAAHWRSAHYRKLPEGQQPSNKQHALAQAYGQSPPSGQTWVRGASVTGIEAERVYRSRSVAKLLFDAIPSKGQALGGLSWFNFERYCGGWLRRQGFDEVARKSVDRGVDITAFKDRSGKAEEWSVQCKHWANKVGPDVVRELEGARRLRNADRAMLITSSAFTPAAIQTASELGIVLVDGDQLSDGDV